MWKDQKKYNKWQTAWEMNRDWGKNISVKEMAEICNQTVCEFEQSIKNWDKLLQKRSKAKK